MIARNTQLGSASNTIKMYSQPGINGEGLGYLYATRIIGLQYPGPWGTKLAADPVKLQELAPMILEKLINIATRVQLRAIISSKQVSVPITTHWETGFPVIPDPQDADFFTEDSGIIQP